MTTSERVEPVSRGTEEIETEIRGMLESRTDRAVTLGAPFAHSWQLAARCVLGGKLLRPRLLIGAFAALVSSSGRGVTAARAVFAEPVASAGVRAACLRTAAGIELLHFSFLLHDDVIDGDLVRRGRPNFIGLQLQEWEPSAEPALDARSYHPQHLHRARSNAILIGDMLLSTAHHVFASQALPQESRTRLLELLDRTVTESVAGELTDVALSGGQCPAELETVLDMSRQKTATYSFELPLRAAAVLAEVGPIVEDSLGRVGRLLGLAFQLQDDLLSTFGAPEDHGKDAYSDLREGKETAIIAFARKTTAWPNIEPRFGRSDLSARQGEELSSLLEECGAADDVRTLIDDLVSNTRDLVATQPTVFEPELARFIGSLIKKLDGRRA